MHNNYQQHNESIREHFANRPDDFLEVNIANEEDYGRFVEFIGVDSPYNDFPWENATESV